MEPMFLKDREQRFAGRFSLSASDGQDERECAFELIEALRKSESDLAGSSIMVRFHMSSKWGNQHLLQTNPTFTLCDEGEQAPQKVCDRVEVLLDDVLSCEMDSTELRSCTRATRADHITCVRQAPQSET